MTGTDTDTATAQAMTDVINWTRGTYKQHGQPQSFYYWGSGSEGNAEDGLLVTSVKVSGPSVIMKGKGDYRKVDVRMRFWASPAPVVPQPRKTDDAKAIERAAAPSKATRPSRNAKLAPCHCGCGAQVKGLYKQGHDARHAGNVAREALAAGSDADLSAILAELPTEALRIKAAKMVAARVK